MAIANSTPATGKVVKNFEPLNKIAVSDLRLLSGGANPAGLQARTGRAKGPRVL
jgi:hypothetical protein